MVSRRLSLRRRSLALTAGLILATIGCSGSKNTRPNGGSGGRGPGGTLGRGGSGASGSGGRGGTSGREGGTTPMGGLAGLGGGMLTGGSAGAPLGASGGGGAPGSGGATGSTGGAAGAGGAGGGTPEICRFDIKGALSPAIPTVGVVDWSTDLAGLSQARIEFALNDARADEINRGSGGKIDVAATAHRALMLGLKAARTYTYRIVATGAGKVCTSADQTLTTGPATGAPTVTRTALKPAAQARGFIVTSIGYPYQGRPVGPKTAYIIDADGDVVWWAPSPGQCSRALMDWEGANMWMVDTMGEVRRVGMDGTGALNDVAGLEQAHHDLAVLPGGVIATLLMVDGSLGGGSDLVERAADGTIKTIVRLDGTVFTSKQSGTLHANTILYHPADDTYTVGDLFARAFVKLTRQGKVLWQIGGDCSARLAPKCASGDWTANHGHHVLDNGNILFFDNVSLSAPSTARELRVTEDATSLTASPIWSYTGPSTPVLGDVQRLPNGNTLVIFSSAGEIHEVSPSGDVVEVLAAGEPGQAVVVPFGFANFRETLYGPPLR